jgi:hypothetical protein
MANKIVQYLYMAATNVRAFSGDVEIAGGLSITDGLSASVSPGSYLTGTAYNGSTARTFAVDATTTNTANKVVARDGNGDFSAGTITASLSGSASSATTAGSATDAENIQVDREDANDTDCYITFTKDSTAGKKRLYMDNSLKYDTITNQIQLNSLKINDWIYRAAETYTKFGFDSSKFSVYMGGNEAFNVNAASLVGIGTSDAKVGLDVRKSTNVYSQANRGKARYFKYDLALTYLDPFVAQTVSIFSENTILCNGYIASVSFTVTSDERIKKEIVDVEDDSALETLRLLKPKRYKYKDEVNRGSDLVWGFIAQEVRETLPYSTHIQTGYVPTIYEMANVSASNVITFTNFNTSNLQSNATSEIMLYDYKDESHTVKIVSVLDEHSIQVKEDLSAWTRSLDEDGNVVSGNQIFVYGEEVNDFVYLTKDAIWTVATAALQEVDRQLQAEKSKVASLETQLTSVLARLDALEGA